MLKGHPLKKYLPYAIGAAVVYSIIAWIYLGQSNYQGLWILFIGNAGFAVVISLLAYFLYTHFINTRSITKMVIGLHATSMAAILLSCLLCLAGLLILTPEVFFPSKSDALLAEAPSQLAGAKHGLVMALFFNAVIGNAATGFFISLILPFSLMRNQKGNKEGENQGPGKPIDEKANTKVDSLDQPIESGQR